MYGEEAVRHDQGREQIGWSDQVAQAQGGKEHLAKGSDIQHAPGAVQTVQGFYGPSAEAVFAVIVVLDDPGACLSTPFEQRQPTAQVHSDAGWELMRRRDDSQARLWTELPPGLDIKALLINWSRHQ